MKKRTKRLLLLGLGILLICLGVKYSSNIFDFFGLLLRVIMPLITGCIIAYVINIPMNALEKLYFAMHNTPLAAKTRRPVCLTLAILFVVLALGLVIWLVLPELIEALSLIIAEIPPLVETLRTWVMENVEDLPTLLQDALASLDGDWQSTLQSAGQLLATGAGNLLNFVVTLLSGLVGSITDFIIAFIFALYLLLGKERLFAQADRLIAAYISPRFEEAGRHVLAVVNSTFRSFIVGQCTEACILGILCMLGMLLFGFPYATMTGAVVGVTALIPIMGAYIGAAVGAFMILTVSPLKALLFVLFLIILQQLEGNLIYPKVVGSRIGLPGIWVLAAVTAGGGLWGVPGMLLGVPLAAVAYKLIQENLRSRTVQAEGADTGDGDTPPPDPPTAPEA